MGWVEDLKNVGGSLAGGIAGGVLGGIVGGPAGGVLGGMGGAGGGIEGLGEDVETFLKDPVGEITGAADVEEEAERQAAAQLAAAQSARELNIQRYGEAKELLTPYIGEARTAREQMMVEMGLAPGEAGTAYMQTPGYQSLLEERQRGVQQQAAGAGSLYSGRRMEAAADVGGATQSQFYTNYMNMLQGMGSPGVATNLASLGVGQAATMGQQQIAAQQAASQYMMGGAQARQAAYGDILGAGAAIYSGYTSGAPVGGGGMAAGDAYQPAQQYGYL